MTALGNTRTWLTQLHSTKRDSLRRSNWISVRPLHTSLLAKPTSYPRKMSRSSRFKDLTAILIWIRHKMHTIILTQGISNLSIRSCHHPQVTTIIRRSWLWTHLWVVLSQRNTRTSAELVMKAVSTSRSYLFRQFWLLALLETILALEVLLVKLLQGTQTSALRSET